MTLNSFAQDPRVSLSRSSDKVVLRRIFDAVELTRLKGWRAFREGIDILSLYGNPEAAGGVGAALLRYRPGARVPLHVHGGHEHIIVLDGAQYDAHGSYGPGTCVVSGPGSRHAVASENGCIVLAIWNQPVRFLPEAASAVSNNPSGTERDTP